MAKNAVRLENKIVVPVVDKMGNTVDERELYNVPLVPLFGEQPVVFKDWLAWDAIRPEPSEVAEPFELEVDGKVIEFVLAGWGSAVKRGHTIHMTSDIGVDCGMFTLVEDAVRLKRWLFAEGLRGGVMADELRVKIVRPGTVVDGHVIHDGYGLISRELADVGWDGGEKIRLGASRESFQFWQRVPPTDLVWSVVQPLVREHLFQLSDPGTRSLMGSVYLQEKQAWIEMDPEEMRMHPYVVNSLAAETADMFCRAAGTCPTFAEVRLAVPARVPKIATQEDVVAYRYPIDAWSSIQAVDGDPSVVEEEARVASLEHIQVSVSTKTFFASGIVAVTDLDGCDLVLCTENVKLCTENRRKMRAPREVVLDNAVVPFMQWFDAGSAMGLNYEWFAANMGGDFDGDLVTFFRVHQTDRDFTAIADAIREFPEQITPKLKKSKTPLKAGDRRAEMAVNNMVNLVGMAANLQATTMMTTNRDMLATAMGFASVQAMDAFFWWALKAGTDGFKSFVLYKDVRGKDVPVTMDQIMEDLGRMQSAMLRLFGTVAPWTRWKRDDYAFKHSVPKVILEGIGEDMYRVAGSEEPVFLERDVARMGVWPWMDSLVARIAKMALPEIESAISHQVEAYPLSHYTQWAPRVTDEIYTLVRQEIQDVFNASVRRVNWTDEHEAGSFKKRFASMFDALVDQHRLDRRTAGAALWRVAHGVRSEAAGAASAFICAPDVAEWIIREKVGLEEQDGLDTLVIGLDYNLIGPPAGWLGEVEVREVRQPKNGKTVVRTVLVPIDTSHFTFKMKDPDTIWPLDMIGVVKQEKPQPARGCYMCNLQRIGVHKVWSARLVPLG